MNLQKTGPQRPVFLVKEMISLLDILTVFCKFKAMRYLIAIAITSLFIYSCSSTKESLAVSESEKELF